MAQGEYTLGEIARFLGAELRGDPEAVIVGIATLQAADKGQISFLSSASYARYLADTKASAIIVGEGVDVPPPVNALVVADPYLCYARLSHWFDQTPAAAPGVHPSAVVAEDAVIPASASIGPLAVIEAGVVLGESVTIGAGCVVGAHCQIGDHTVLQPRVTLGHHTILGKRCHILSGAVLGSDGFGFANEKGVWHRIAQLGRVVLGDDVEVGANTTIDRGALDDTRLENGVKLDNLVQIAHNVTIGEHSAMAAMVGIAGSTRIGRHCVFGGATGVAGHLTIGDQVHMTGMTMVTGNIKEPGVYSSGTNFDTNRQWRKNAVRFRQLDAMARRLKELEKKIEG
ncbi:UDP-3-O-(3-hydroxymyristoyl)glucosamine N-acyltransferase [Marinobacter sp. X15-166B]|uniref:UDP-3-O-(3-hydroxymyristoyl)glucosamine N-acyltransferase n=1 Tax=Marinobacter sp. X15-166B TaxID=1897620 RepID=UPI00085BCE9F|nr:UDP-3-O-(3-hydroxymyristoyl)glucosamine N-acyltransferase [Marinobacter sp. X15-166B]OEY67035.1 UDP-3-O-(3-hydroxymyristoyl)glucosamine N-acyltransferase [Marinobacter sp. X15-166B]